MAALAMLGSFLCVPVQGAEGDIVVVSVKHILDSRGRRSNGRYTTDAQIKAAIMLANNTLSRNKASWRLWDVTLIVESWIDVRSANGRAPLFCTLQGKPLDTAYVRALLRLAGASRVRLRR